MKQGALAVVLSVGSVLLVACAEGDPPTDAELAPRGARVSCANYAKAHPKLDLARTEGPVRTQLETAREGAHYITRSNTAYRPLAEALDQVFLALESGNADELDKADQAVALACFNLQNSRPPFDPEPPDE